jgi:hypothetical protein
MTPHRLAPILLVLFAASGCTEEEQQAATYARDKATRETLIQQREEYYSQPSHREELRAKRDACRELPEEQMDSDIDCVAAFRAALTRL